MRRCSFGEKFHFRYFYLVGGAYDRSRRAKGKVTGRGHLRVDNIFFVNMPSVFLRHHCSLLGTRTGWSDLNKTWLRCIGEQTSLYWVQSLRLAE